MKLEEKFVEMVCPRCGGDVKEDGESQFKLYVRCEKCGTKFAESKRKLPVVRPPLPIIATCLYQEAILYDLYGRLL